MILDSLERLDAYSGILPDLALVKAWLAGGAGKAEKPPSERPEGRTGLDGDRVYLMVSENQGRGEKNSPLECHRRYIDVQIALRGEDRIGWLPLSSCSREREAFDNAADIGFFLDAPGAWLDLKPGWFCVFFPEDAHAPLAGQGPVKKAVFKIAVSRP